MCGRHPFPVVPLKGDIMRVIAVGGLKGGPGKTTISVGLSAAVANAQRRVLLIDMDPQANASQTVLPDYEERLAAGTLFTTHDLTEPGVDPADVPDAITATAWPGVDLIASAEALAQREFENTLGMDTRMRRAITGIPDVYDTVILDCPPSLGRLTVNAMLAAEGFLMVAEADNYSSKALLRTLRTLEEARVAYDHPIQALGIVVNRFDAGTKEDRKRLKEFRKQHVDDVLAVIPKRTVIRRAAGNHQSVFQLQRPDAAEVAGMYTELAGRLGLLEARKPSVEGVVA